MTSQDAPPLPTLEVLEVGFGRLRAADRATEDVEPLSLDRADPPQEPRPRRLPAGPRRTWIAIALAFALGIAAGEVAAHSKAQLIDAAEVSLVAWQLRITGLDQTQGDGETTITYAVPLYNAGPNTAEVMSISPVGLPDGEVLPIAQPEILTAGETRPIASATRLDRNPRGASATDGLTVHVRTINGSVTSVIAPLSLSSRALLEMWRSICTPDDAEAPDEHPAPKLWGGQSLEWS